MANLLPGYTKVLTRYTSNAAGRGTIVVKWDGKQKSVPSNLQKSGTAKHEDAVQQVFPGKTVEPDIDQRGNRKSIVWYVH